MPAQRGWRMPPLKPWRGVIAALEEAGYVELREQDLSSEAAMSTEKISKRWIMFTLLTGPTGGQNRASQEFTEATVNYNQGLQEGVFTYHFISGARPV